VDSHVERCATKEDASGQAVEEALADTQHGWRCARGRGDGLARTGTSDERSVERRGSVAGGNEQEEHAHMCLGSSSDNPIAISCFVFEHVNNLCMQPANALSRRVEGA